MTDAAVRSRVHEVLGAVRNRPTEIPLAEIAALHSCGVDVEIDLAGDDTVVYVRARTDDRLSGLTKREREVATLAAAGMSNQQIATALFVSVATVKDHMHSILAKTGLRSRAQVIAAWYGGLPREP